MFTIYSIGDSAFLAQILNSLAMICGTGDFEQLVAIGLLLGFFVMGVQCIMSATRQFNLHQVFLGFICYLCFFGPAVTVHVEDAYTGQVRTVDNVPIGAGVAGTLISNIGYGITQLFEQGYGDVDRMTEQSFGDALKALNVVRAIAYDASIVDAASQSLGANVNLRKSLDNYIRECTMVKIVVGQGTPEEIYRGGIDALGYQNTIYGTEVHLPGYNGVNLDCDAAWKQLKPQFQQAVESPQAIAALNRLAGSADAQGQVSATYDRVNSALEALNASQITARDYVSIALLEPIYRRAAKGFYNDMGDSATAVMINQALEQHNTQWAAEQTMFLSTVRPLMAFFEGFIYAITPFMAFMMVMGAFGMTMITKYFQVVCWIQLWMPVLSIVNLFIMMAARNQFASIVTDPMSFYTLNNGSQILQNWIATGGMLAAATPMIALFLVTGSTYAFTSLTNRMGGGDHINEKIASPDMVKPAEILSMMPQATSSAIGGVTATGSVIPTFAVGKGLEQNVSAAETNLRTKSDAWSESRTKTASDQSILATAAAISKVTGQTDVAQKAQTFATGENEVAQAGNQSASKTGTTNAVGGAVQATAGGSGSFGLKAPNVSLDPNNPKTGGTNTMGAQVSGGVTGSAGATTQTSAGHEHGTSHGRNVTTNFTQQERAEMQKTFSDAVQNMTSEQLSQLQSELQQAGISSNLSDVIAAQESYSKAVTARDSIGMTTTGKLNEVAGEIAANKEAANALHSQFTTMSQADKQAVNSMAKKYEDVNKIDSARAHDMAILQHMTNTGRLGEAASIYAKSQGYDAPAISGPGENNIPKPREADRSRENELSDHSFNRGQFNDKKKQIEDTVARGDDFVKQGGNYAKGQVQNAVDENTKKAKERQIDAAVENLFMNRDPHISSFFNGILESVGNAIKSTSDFDGMAQFLQKEAGLTATQAQYMTNQMKPFKDREDTSNYEKGLFAETKAMLGIDQNDHGSDAYVQSVTDRIKDRLNTAAYSGIKNGGVGVLSQVMEFNDATRDRLVGFNIASGSGAEPSLLSPDNGGTVSQPAAAPAVPTAPGAANPSSDYGPAVDNGFSPMSAGAPGFAPNRSSGDGNDLPMPFSQPEGGGQPQAPESQDVEPMEIKTVVVKSDDYIDR